MTGPTFVGNTLLVSVQHPSEDSVFDASFAPDTAILTREIELLGLNGKVFTQNRTVPRGSNWPSNLAGDLNGLPRPCVVGIRRKENQNRFI
jgi:secreted PhoX family phosphatase